MGIRIFQQPDGQYAVLSSVVDDFLLEDATEEEVREWYIERRKQRAEENVDEMLEDARDGTFVNNGPTSYEEAVKHVERVNSSS